MDDVFDEYADEKALGLSELDRMKEQFHTVNKGLWDVNVLDGPKRRNLAEKRYS